MNIRDLQYLVAVHDLNNFSKAAERCYVSQPTLSGQLKKLEQELGATLIERSTRRVLFTQLGEKIVDQARQLLATADNIKTLVSANDDPMAGEFHIGLVPTIGPYLLPLVMPAISEKFPQAKLYLYELQSEVLQKKLSRGELDAVIVAKQNCSTSLEEIELFSESMCLAVSAQDQAEQLENSVALSILKDQAILMLEDGHCLREHTLEICAEAGAHEDTRFKATTMDTLLHMVANGVGMTLVPELACQKELKGVNFFEFEPPQPKREVVMLVRNNSARIETMKVFATAIQSEVKKNENDV